MSTRVLAETQFEQECKQKASAGCVPLPTPQKQETRQQLHQQEQARSPVGLPGLAMLMLSDAGVCD
eukprot:scaffold84082_cov18-Tisochrysis_lutea.AAC.3